MVTESGPTGEDTSVFLLFQASCGVLHGNRTCMELLGSLVQVRMLGSFIGQHPGDWPLPHDGSGHSNC